MGQPTRYAGLDVHRDSVVVALVPRCGPVEEIKQLPHDLPKLKRFFQKVLEDGSVEACYEAGGCGYGLQRSLEKWGVPCQVVAPSLIPKAPGDRVKTDRRDAAKLAIALRVGDLTSIHVPNEAEERIRALVRARESMHGHLHACQQQILKFLQLRGLVFRDGKNWGRSFWSWFDGLEWKEPLDQKMLTSFVALRTLSLQLRDDLQREVEAVSVKEDFWGRSAVARLRCLHGVDTLTAMVLVTEIIDAARFPNPRELMGYLGLISGEYTSGARVRRGGITKAGNKRVRRVLGEAAWHYQYPPRGKANARCEGQSPEVVAYAHRAHLRLHARFRHLAMKDRKIAVTAVARELVGFVWALMRAEPELLRPRPTKKKR